MTLWFPYSTTHKKYLDEEVEELHIKTGTKRDDKTLYRLKVYSFADVARFLSVLAEKGGTFVYAYVKPPGGLLSDYVIAYWHTEELFLEEDFT